VPDCSVLLNCTLSNPLPHLSNMRVRVQQGLGGSAASEAFGGCLTAWILLFLTD
jgi:hypothetical protein